MLEGGEDPLFLARRMIRGGSEDVGLADPTALMICNEAAAAYRAPGIAGRRARAGAGGDGRRAEVQRGVTRPITRRGR